MLLSVVSSAARPLPAVAHLYNVCSQFYWLCSRVGRLRLCKEITENLCSRWNMFSAVRSRNVQGYSTCTEIHYDPLTAVLLLLLRAPTHMVLCVSREAGENGSVMEVSRSGLTLFVKLSAQEVVLMFLTSPHILHLCRALTKSPLNRAQAVSVLSKEL